MGTERAVLDYVLANAPAGDPGAVLAAVDRFGRGGGHWMMNLGNAKARIVEDAIGLAGARRVLELGSYFGYSAIVMARRVGPGGTVVTIDADRERHDVSRRMVAHAGLADRVELRLGRAEDVIPALAGPFDFVLIDHYGENYLSDLELIESRGLLRPGAVVAADNAIVHRPTVDPYLDHVRNGRRYRSTLHKAGRDGVEVSIWLGE
jgi:catechol O-methyltransferase